ncbi:unnamed protein product, partial [Choristocarpus tenellus]
QVRRQFEKNLDELLALPQGALEVKDPPTTVGVGALGYYLIYQGKVDKTVRRKLAQTYWRFAPSLRYCAPFLLEKCDSTEGSVGVCEQATEEAARPNDQGRNRSGEWVPGLEHDKTQDSCSMRKRDVSRKDLLEHEIPPRRLRVAFLSAFFFHHSVGLLTKGVILSLDRERFEVTAIFVQPNTAVGAGARPKVEVSIDEYGGDHHVGSGNGDGEGDAVYRELRAGVERVLDIPAGSLPASRTAIAALELDVLVFTEIGMDHTTYFLSFARLARRTVLFWGHAVTSGVSSVDALIGKKDSQATKDIGDQEGAGNPHAVSGKETAGGLDYFVSSRLFENLRIVGDGSEVEDVELYLMDGLTTRFPIPSPPREGMTRADFGIPLPPPNHSDTTLFLATTPAPATAVDIVRSVEGVGDLSNSSHGTSIDLGKGSPVDKIKAVIEGQNCGAIYLVPQTLYKLHPDFDHLIGGVLRSDPTGCVCLLVAGRGGDVTARLARRLRNSLEGWTKDKNDGIWRRVIFVRRLAFDEFAALAQAADVVLDPFPVGGGRSSLEVLAVGTPIVMLYNRTSVLQLTYGMYATMGLEG